MESITTDKLYDLERRVTLLEELMVKNARRETTREREMVEVYGEYVNKSEAASILGVCRATIYTMMGDGRIKGGMAGSKISVRSIARYMDRTGRRDASNDR